MIPEPTEQYRLLELLARGGWTMYPLLLCSIVALGVSFERLANGPKRKKVIPDSLVRELRELSKAGRFEEIVGLCRASASPLSRIVLTAVRNIEKPRNLIVEAVERTGRQELARLQKFLGILGTIAAITPLLGLLGTVSGMIETFYVIKREGVGNADALSGGIAEALVTTATGLSIAIPTLVLYRFFMGRSKQLILELEQIAADFLDDIIEIKSQQPAKQQAQL